MYNIQFILIFSRVYPEQLPVNSETSDYRICSGMHTGRLRTLGINPCILGMADIHPGHDTILPPLCVYIADFAARRRFWRLKIFHLCELSQLRHKRFPMSMTQSLPPRPHLGSIFKKKNKRGHAWIHTLSPNIFQLCSACENTAHPRRSSAL